jgi:hypothetical protein
MYTANLQYIVDYCIARKRGMDEIRELLDKRAVLPLWPDTGKILDLSRAGTYAAAR